jgi:hypothetical protein
MSDARQQKLVLLFTILVAALNSQTSFAAVYGTWEGTKFYRAPGMDSIPYRPRSNGGPYVWVPQIKKTGDWCKYKMLKPPFPVDYAWAKCDSINRNDFGGV